MRYHLLFTDYDDAGCTVTHPKIKILQQKSNELISLVINIFAY